MIIDNDIDWIEYYANLLILQYRSKTKAPQHIRALLKMISIFELLQDIRDGFSVGNSIGAQQDIVGKYVGANRVVTGTAFTRNYWGYCEYGDSAPFDFYPYMSYGEIPPDVQIRNYKESSQSLFTLNDEEFRSVIRMKIIQNNSNHSSKEIDEFIYKYFPTQAIFSDFIDRCNMTITYIFNEAMERIVDILISEKLLPKPAGVATLVSFTPDINHIFGYSNYSGSYPDFIVGYIEYGAVPQGGWLQYGSAI